MNHSTTRGPVRTAVDDEPKPSAPPERKKDEHQPHDPGVEADPPPRRPHEPPSRNDEQHEGHDEPKRPPR